MTDSSSAHPWAHDHFDAFRAQFDADPFHQMLGITYLRQAQGKEIFAEARVIKRGRQLAVIEVEICDAEGRLCAKGRTLYAFRASA